jgi:hypothetical protein
MCDSLFTAIMVAIIGALFTFFLSLLYLWYIKPYMDNKEKIKDEDIKDISNILKELNKASIETVGFSIQIKKKEGNMSICFTEQELEKIEYALKSLKKPHHTLLEVWNHLNNPKKNININYQNLEKIISNKISTKNEKHRKQLLKATEHLSNILLKKTIKNITPDRLSRAEHMGNIQMRYNNEVIDDFHNDVFEKYEIEKFLSELIDSAGIKKELEEIKGNKKKMNECFNNFKYNIYELSSLSKNKLKKRIKIRKIK